LSEKQSTGFDAAIFDLDGVLTDTARVHAATWKTVFDQFLQAWAQQHALPFRPFDIDADYLNYVDGRPASATSSLPGA
jgi:alpha,alpha-trehalase